MHVKAQKSMKSKEMSVDLGHSIISRQRSQKGYRKTSPAFKVTMSAMASVMNKWKKFEMTGWPI